MTGSRVVIVGAGHAGTTLAGLLRQDGYDGEILMFGDEPDHPYQRPPLSKKLNHDTAEEALRPPEFYRQQRITLRLGERVQTVDRTRRRVHSAAGHTWDYDHLVLATGARPRTLPLPGAHADGVVSLRTQADARLIRTHLADKGRLAIIGGGYVGLEVAAAARSAGADVTVVEREQRVLARVASAALADSMAAYHRDRGTTIVTGCEVRALTTDGSHVQGVELGSGEVIPSELVLVGIGAVPNDDLARAAGLHCDQGVVVDERARTSDPSVLAIGDVTRRPVPGRADTLRLESIPSATEQAKQACAVILDAASPAPDIPWFWSDQFDLKLKIAGLVRPGAGPVSRGDRKAGRVTFFHLDGDRVDAVESVNTPAEFMAARKLIATRQRVDPALLARPDTPLRDAVLT